MWILLYAALVKRCTNGSEQPFFSLSFAETTVTSWSGKYFPLIQSSDYILDAIFISLVNSCVVQGFYLTTIINAETHHPPHICAHMHCLVSANFWHASMRCFIERETGDYCFLWLVTDQYLKVGHHHTNTIDFTQWWKEEYKRLLIIHTHLIQFLQVGLEEMEFQAVGWKGKILFAEFKSRTSGSLSLSDYGVHSYPVDLLSVLSSISYW